MNNDSSELFGAVIESYALGMLLKDKLESNDMRVNFSIGHVSSAKNTDIKLPEDLYDRNSELSDLPSNFYRQIKIVKQMFRNLEILYNTKHIPMDHFFTELSNYYNVPPEEFYRLINNLKKEMVISEVADNVYQLI